MKAERMQRFRGRQNMKEVGSRSKRDTKLLIGVITSQLASLDRGKQSGRAEFFSPVFMLGTKIITKLLFNQPRNVVQPERLPR
jgi:hypothetical protein